MFTAIHNFIQLVFIGIIALFPVINPIGSAFIVSQYFEGLNNLQKRKMIKKIAFYVFILCAITLFTGHWILELFGISVPIIQLAGGIMICKLGWESLSAQSDSNTNVSEKPIEVSADILNNLSSKVFYPITFPITAGAGTISVIFTLSANAESKNLSEYVTNTGAILLAIIIMTILVYFCYFNAGRLINYLGSTSEKIISRLMAFLIFCVGLQIAVGGITSLIKLYRGVF